jgi:DNA-binding IclR family transcriptional regulator
MSGWYNHQCKIWKAFFLLGKRRREMSSLEKSLMILKRLGDSPYELNLSELASHVGMGKSGAFKLINVMKKHNFVIQDPSSKKYHLGPIMLRLGNVYSRFKGIEQIAKPLLFRISKSFQETTYLTIWEGDRAFPAYKNSVKDGIYEYNDFIGMSLPLNSGASAMVLCAYQDPGHIREILGSMKLEKRTSKTMTDLDQLMDEYRIIRERGYALEDETFSLGILSIAVPVFDKDRRVWSCLALAAPKAHATDGNVDEWIQALKEGAEELSYNLQFRH